MYLNFFLDVKNCKEQQNYNTGSASFILAHNDSDNSNVPIADQRCSHQRVCNAQSMYCAIRRSGPRKNVSECSHSIYKEESHPWDAATLVTLETGETSMWLSTRDHEIHENDYSNHYFKVWSNMRRFLPSYLRLHIPI